MPPKFLADSMLGKVARWLVLMGFDAAYAGVDGRSDKELLEQARSEGRIFLTRDTRIPEVSGIQVVVLRSQKFEVQLRQVFKQLGLKRDQALLFTRCTWCNQALDKLPLEKALPLVPERVRELRTEFFQCPKCARMYWTGTHTERTVKTLEKMGL